jgi:hypothetical protein
VIEERENDGARPLYLRALQAGWTPYKLSDSDGDGNLDDDGGWVRER